MSTIEEEFVPPVSTVTLMARVLVFLAFMSALVWGGLMIIKSDSNISKTEADIAPVTASADTGNPREIELLEAYVWTARTRLEGLDLDRMLRVSTLGSDRIVITGSLDKRLSGRFEMFKHWFASKPSFPELVDEVSIRQTSLGFPAIQSVWLGPIPVLQLENGTSIGVGGELAKDWIVTSIDALAVTLEHRDGTVIELSFTEG